MKLSRPVAGPAAELPDAYGDGGLDRDPLTACDRTNLEPSPLLPRIASQLTSLLVAQPRCLLLQQSTTTPTAMKEFGLDRLIDADVASRATNLALPVAVTSGVISIITMLRSPRIANMAEQVQKPPSTSDETPTDDARPLAFDFKDSMTLLMSLSQRAHNAWSAHVAGALVVGGWLLTRHKPLSIGQLIVVIVAVVVGTALNLFTTLAIYRYFNAVMREVKAASGAVRFWNDTGTRHAVSQLKAISPTAVVAINLIVAVLLSVTAVVVYLGKA